MKEVIEMTPNPVPHLCGGILFDLLLEARKPRQKARNKLNGGSDGLTIPGVYAGLVYIVTGEDYSSIAGTTLNKCATNYKNAMTVQATMFLLQKQLHAPHFKICIKQINPASSSGQQGL